MPEDQDRAESPGLEEELPTPLNNGSVDQHAADQQNIRSTSPPKRSAAHMENDEDADMRETTEVDSTGPATGRNNGTSNGSSHQIPRSTEMHTNDQMLDCTTATNSVDSDPTSASAQSSSAATSLGSSPFHMSAPTEDRVLESNGDLAERPSYDEQYQRVLQMMMEPPQDGDVGFLVASKWLMRVMARTSSPPDGLDKEALEGEIGPVDNSSILQPGELALHPKYLSNRGHRYAFPTTK